MEDQEPEQNICQLGDPFICKLLSTDQEWIKSGLVFHCGEAVRRQKVCSAAKAAPHLKSK